MDEILEKELVILETLLGPIWKKLEQVTVFVAGNLNDFECIRKGQLEEADRRFPIKSAASCIPQKQEILILYNGSDDWRIFAHELVHHLLHTLYIEHPSMFVNKGLADYIAFEVEKKSAKLELFRQPNQISWQESIDGWQSAREFLDFWEAYEKQWAHITRILNLQASLPLYFQLYTQFRYMKRQFYVHAWSLVHFFLEGGTEEDRYFFLSLLLHEVTRQTNRRFTVKTYFDECLTGGNDEALNCRWGRHVLNLTYETV